MNQRLRSFWWNFHYSFCISSKKQFLFTKFNCVTLKAISCIILVRNFVLDLKTIYFKTISMQNMWKFWLDSLFQLERIYHSTIYSRKNTAEYLQLWHVNKLSLFRHTKKSLTHVTIQFTKMNNSRHCEYLLGPKMILENP